MRNNRSEESIGTSENSFTYDLNNRLIKRESIDTETDYYYDNRGNLYLKTNTSYLESGIPGTEVTSMGESEFFEYDGFNRLTNYTKGGNKAEYEYNSSGIRTSKTVVGASIGFIIGLSGQYIYVSDDKEYFGVYASYGMGADIEIEAEMDLYTTVLWSNL